MKEANGILTIGPGDLTLEAREKKFKEVDLYDIAWDMAPARNAAVVLFVDDRKGKMKIMKSRYRVIS